MATLIERAIGAARLDVATFEEIEHDESALGQAMTVVVVAAIASGIGSSSVSGGHGPGLIFGAVGALIAWFVWAFTIYVVGTRLLPMPETKADLGQLLRTLGFAAGPGAVGLLGILPLVGGLAMTAAWIWQLAAMVVAVRQALDYASTGRAIGVCVIGFVAQFLVLFALFAIVAGGMAALFGGGSATVAP